jgi:hypothetical protein
MISNGNTRSAKELLKKSVSYIGSTDPDPILLATALSNLCVLRMEEGKYYKSLNILLQIIESMEDYMKELKHSARKNQMMEDSVFLVNAYYLLTKCLKNIMEKNHKSLYR